MPLFSRYTSGNVVDVSTITRTIAELRANGVSTKSAILDAGYYTGINADALLDVGISFMTRMKSNFRVHQNAVKRHLKTLESKENDVLFQCCKIHRKLPNGSERIKHPSEQRPPSWASYPPVKEFALSGSLLLGAAIGYFELYNDAYQAQILYL